VQLAEPDRAEFVELNRTTLRLWCWGDPSAPPVVLVHGAYDHGRMFDELAPAVAALGYHAIAVDLRGHGDSGPLRTGWAWALLHLDLGLLIRHLGGGPVGFVAHSFGGGQATGVAGVFPELVRWIVNIDGLGPPPTVFEERPEYADFIARSFVAIDRAAGPPREWTTQEEMVDRRSKMNPRLPREWVEHLVRHGTKRGPQGNWVWKADAMFGVGWPGGFNIDMLRAELSAARCPVRVLTGTEHDMWNDLSIEQLAERVGWMPNASHALIEGAGHYAHIERPDDVLAHIEDLAREVGAA
jgi:pimeloyl-ACP methyl ester carboxylesterase